VREAEGRRTRSDSSPAPHAVTRSGGALRVYTLGFSTRTVDEVVEMLRGAGVAQLVDVRTVPRSRHTPQWNREYAGGTFPPHGIRYRHLPALGGFRKPRPDSPNTGWHNPSFQGYADYMGTPRFAEGLAELLELAREAPTAIACTEAVPWRCHRSLIADALTVRGVEVRHLMSATASRPHALTPFARVEGLALTYPDPDSLF